jgi:hypothetical protein
MYSDRECQSVTLGLATVYEVIIFATYSKTVFETAAERCDMKYENDSMD